MARSSLIFSHWHHLADNFETSALEFYATVERAVEERRVPGTSRERIDYRESGLASGKREYLRISRGTLHFDICAAPYGTSYFFSWWLVEQPSRYLFMALLALVGLAVLLLTLVSKYGLTIGLVGFVAILIVIALVVSRGGIGGSLPLEEAIVAIPMLGPVYQRFFRPVTYYSEDTRLMFQDSIHRAVLTVVSELRSAQGLRALSVEEERPQVRDLVR